MDEDERHDLLARRSVWLLHHAARLPMRRGALQAELAGLVPDPAKAVRRLGIAQVLVVSGDGPIDDMWCAAGRGIGELPTVEYIDVTAVVVEHGGDYCVTAVRHGDSEPVEGAAYVLSSDTEHLRALRTAIASIRAGCPYVHLSACADELGRALFGRSEVGTAIRDELAAGRRVRVRLLARGRRLATLPWEVARAPGSRPAFGDPRLAVVRIVPPNPGTVPLPAPPDWLHFPRVEYVHLGTDEKIDQWDDVQRLTRACGWPEARRLQAAEFLAAEPAGATGPALLHIVGHNTTANGGLRLDGCPVERPDFVEAVLARGPALVYLGICHGTAPMASGASVAWELCAQGVPTVIGLRGESAVDAQVAFVEELYQRLSLTLSVDDAVSTGRAAVYDAAQALQFVHFQREGPVTG